MRNIPCAVLCAAVVLSSVAFGTQADARNVCGMNGCAPVLVKRMRVPPRLVSATPAPQVVSNTAAPAAAPASSALLSLPSLPSLSSLPSPLSLLQGK